MFVRNRAREPLSTSSRFARIAARSPAFVACLMGISSVAPVQAEISVKLDAQGGARFDTNPRFQSSDRESDSAWGSLVDVRLDMDYSSPRGSISLDPRILFNFYLDDKDKDLEDRNGYLTGTASRNFRQSSLSAAYGYTNLGTRVSEFEGVDDNVTGGSGGTLEFADSTQEHWFFKPSGQYQLSRTNTISVNAGYDDVSYDDDFISNRFDYEVVTAGASFQHVLNPRHIVALRGGLSKFESKSVNLDIENDSDTNSLSIVYFYSWTENTRISADVGWANTKSVVRRPNQFFFGVGLICDTALILCELDFDSTNFIGNISINNSSETGEYSFAIGQSITPNSNGSEVVRFNVDASASKRFSNRLSGRIGLFAFKQDNVGDENDAFRRDFFSGSTEIQYGFTQYWSAFARYRFSIDKQRAQIDDRSITNNTVSIGIRYLGKGWRW